ncbi:hypothetical protein N7326_02500 [Corynebacterium sp. ES2794-CONJ1]|uniref:hypothetical protein n=1 Tax=unclassified Corynebacterium TaxID=2624378 RepID=UPI00216B5B2D|nr:MULTISPECIES: hypothetical protein [unclassified Corynebacterium]MCS4531355.1 hypothetical protein [Corynebacterium sp. ES2730-CONJ]MCU9518743.1 hypothetical protein [Corynebacterium sp. ES2794-CONJ1]
MKKAVLNSILSLAVVSSLAAGTISQPALAQPLDYTVAQARGGSTIPNEFLIEPKSDSASYTAAFELYDQIYKARSYYSEGAQAFWLREAPNEWAGRFYARNQTLIAQAAREMIILQAEDFQGARDLDVSSIGVDPVVEASAAEIIDRAMVHFTELKATSDRQLDIQNRLDNLGQAKSGLNNYKGDEKFIFRIPSAAVVNWGVPQKYLDSGRSPFTPSDFAGITVTQVAYSATDQAQQVSQEALEADALTNATPQGPTATEVAAPLQKALNDVVDGVLGYSGKVLFDEWIKLAKIADDAARLLAEVNSLERANNVAGIEAQTERVRQLESTFIQASQAIDKERQDLLTDLASALEAVRTLDDADLTQQAEELKADFDKANNFAISPELKKRLKELQSEIAKRSGINQDDQEAPTDQPTPPAEQTPENPAPPADPGQQPEQDPEASSLGAGAIAGIVLAVVAVVGGIMAALSHMLPQLGALAQTLGIRI